MAIDTGKTYSRVKLPKRVVVDLGWDPATNGATYDLDLSAFLLDEKRQLIGDEYLVYYKDLDPFSGAIVHSGDDVDGRKSKTEEDESIQLDLDKIPREVAEIVFVVTINQALQRGQMFKDIPNSFVRVREKRKKICFKALSIAYPNADNYEFARFSRVGQDWYCQLIEDDISDYQGNSLDAYIKKYGGSDDAQTEGPDQKLSLTIDYADPSIAANGKRTILSPTEAILIYFYWRLGKTFPDSLYRSIALYRQRLESTVEKSVKQTLPRWVEKFATSKRFTDPGFNNPDVDNHEVAHELSSLRNKLKKELGLDPQVLIPSRGRLFHLSADALIWKNLEKLEPITHV